MGFKVSSQNEPDSRSNDEKHVRMRGSKETKRKIKEIENNVKKTRTSVAPPELVTNQRSKNSGAQIPSPAITEKKVKRKSQLVKDSQSHFL